MEYTLVVIKIDNRENAAIKVQDLLSNFGCYIKVRLGLHDLPSNSCSPSGLIILEVTSPYNELEKFINNLNSLNGVNAKELTI